MQQRTRTFACPRLSIRSRLTRNVETACTSLIERVHTPSANVAVPFAVLACVFCVPDQGNLSHIPSKIRGYVL